MPEKTLLPSTQMVPSAQAETREVMCDHFQTRLPEFKIMRRNDILCMDTFFSFAMSMGECRCWNLHCPAKTSLDVVVPQCFRSQSLSALKSAVTECGVPHAVHADNAKEFKSQKWNAMQCRQSRTILKHITRMKTSLSAEAAH